MRSPLFLAILAVHVVAGLVAVVAGLTAMLSRKGSGRHPKSGTVYFRALIVVTITMTALAIARWPLDNYLALLGILAIACAFIGRRARRDRWSRWPLIHIPAMGASFIFMMIAFYVDNGPNLPVWRRLPPAAYWFIPTAIGVPFIIHALTRYWNADRESSA